MGKVDEEKLQAKYSKQWKDLKHLLLAKHFSGQECKETFSVGNLQVKEFEQPPLKKFVTAPRLREDLAKYLDQE